MAHGNPTSQAGRFRSLALALALAATGAWGMGDSPPEGREPTPAARGACPEQKSGAGAGSGSSGEAASCGTEKAREPSQPEGKSPASRPDRYGTGYEARKGLGGGGGHGRGGRGR